MKLVKTITIAFLLPLLAGCCCCHKKPKWFPPVLAAVRKDAAHDRISCISTPDAMLAEKYYANAVELSDCGSPLSVTAAYRSALAAYRWREFATSTCERSRATEVYHSGITLMLDNAQRHGRFHYKKGLGLDTSLGTQWIPIDYRGFAQKPEDFNSVEVVGEYDVKELNCEYTRCGVGKPVVVQRIRKCRSRFTQKQLSFPATVLLIPDEDSPTDSGRLTFVSPGKYKEIEIGGKVYPLAADFSAPFALATVLRPNAGLQAFLQPGATNRKEQLVMVEPYRTKKIPLLFVHGLLSDPMTWVPIANELKGDPWFRDHYQLWAFRYSTGKPFLTSAVKLREELKAAVDAIEAETGDKRDDIVLIGHSMGGLVSKLQVSRSGEQLWRTASDRPVEALNTTPDIHERLREAFYFEPSSAVSRVVFIGTPHDGSTWARRSVGRLGSWLVRTPSEDAEVHRELVQANRDALAPYMRRRLPTSVDLLEPENPLLKAIRKLPIERRVKFHSVIGQGRNLSFSHEDSDGVVPVDSAKHEGAVSTIYLDAAHSRLHREPFAIRSIKDILRRHWHETQARKRMQVASEQRDSEAAFAAD